MNRANKVTFEGGIDTCRIMGDDGRQTVARLSVYTLHPRPGVSRDAPKSELYERMKHLVRLTVPSSEASWIRDLEADMRSDRGKLRPCHVEGPLVYDAKENLNLVECGPGGVSLRDNIVFENNNVAHIVGDVVSASHTDASAKLTLRTDAGNVELRILRAFSEQAWSDVSTGKVSKGDAVSVDGHVNSNDFTDGNKRIFVSMVVPHQMMKVKLDLERDRRHGVSL